LLAAEWTVDLEMKFALKSVEKNAFNQHGKEEYTITLYITNLCEVYNLVIRLL